MGEGLVFILQRFYIALGPGCIINFYILGMLFVMGKIKFLDDRFRLRLFENIEFSTTVSISIFIAAALIIAVCIEGFTEVFIQRYEEKRIKYLKQKNGREKRTFIGGFLYFNFIKSMTNDACKFYWEQERKGGLPQFKIFTFMYDRNTPHKLIEDPDKVFSIMQISALKISTEVKDNDIYKYRDFTHIIQLMRSSFQFIFLISFLAALCVAFASWINGRSDCMEKLLVYYILCLVISAVLIPIMVKMARDLSKRYVRDVAKWYNALELHNRAWRPLIW
jgi:hypothetical protein